MRQVIACLALASVSLAASFAIAEGWPDQPGPVELAAKGSSPTGTPSKSGVLLIRHSE